MSQSHEVKLQEAKQYLQQKNIGQKVVFGILPRQANIPHGTMAALQEVLLKH